MYKKILLTSFLSFILINTIYANNFTLVEPIKIYNDEFLDENNSYEIIYESETLVSKDIIESIETILPKEEDKNNINKEKKKSISSSGFINYLENISSVEEVKVKNPSDAKLPETIFIRRNAKNKRRNILLVLDPGHGPSVRDLYKDWSTAQYYGIRNIRYNNQTEEEFTFKIAKYMEERLLEEGFDILNTRKDIFAVVPNKLRGIIASELEADHTIYIHWNAGGGRGPLRYLPKDFDFKPWKNEANRMWRKISKRLIEYFEVEKTVDIKGELSVFLTNNTPQTYIEVGFADNEIDIAKMAGDENNRKIANILVEGILDYYGR